MYRVELQGIFEESIKAKSAKDALVKALKINGFKASITKERDYVTGKAFVTDLETKVVEEFLLNKIQWIG